MGIIKNEPLSGVTFASQRERMNQMNRYQGSVPTVSMKIEGRELSGRAENYTYEVMERDRYEVGRPFARYHNGEGGAIPSNYHPSRIFAKKVTVTFIAEEERPIEQDNMMPDNDIFVPKEELWTIKKHLDAIKNMQVDKQKEIRDKNRRTEEFKLRILSV